MKFKKKIIKTSQIAIKKIKIKLEGKKTNKIIHVIFSKKKRERRRRRRRKKY